jgi:hypothetical protein
MSKLRAVKPKVSEVPALVLERAECDMTLDEQLAKARAKIDDSLAAGAIGAASVGQNEMLFALTVMHQLGSFGRHLIFTPQLATCAPFEMPEGFALNVSPNAPVLSMPFSEQAMFNGLLAVPLPASKQLTLQYFGDSKNRVLERLAAELSDSADLGEGDASNFVGFFTSSERGAGTQFWCVTQCHSTELARETHQLIRRAEPESMDRVDDWARRSVDAANRYRQRAHMIENYEVSIDIDGTSATSSSSSSTALATLDDSADAGRTKNASAKDAQKVDYTTWETLFIKTQRMHEIRRLQREHRLATVRKALQLIGLQQPASAESFTLEAPQLIESTFNCVDQVNRKEAFSDLVYLSRMSSVHAIGRNGTIFCDAPSVGVSVLRGPWQIDRVVQRNSKHPLNPFIGVPIGTGWLKTPALWVAGGGGSASVADESLLVNSTHCWSQRTMPNMLFDVRNAHSRVKERKTWTSWLEHCGYPSGTTSTSELPLTPICVRWARPPALPSSYLAAAATTSTATAAASSTENE